MANAKQVEMNHLPPLYICSSKFALNASCFFQFLTQSAITVKISTNQRFFSALTLIYFRILVSFSNLIQLLRHIKSTNSYLSHFYCILLILLVSYVNFTRKQSEHNFDKMRKDNIMIEDYYINNNAD